MWDYIQPVFAILILIAFIRYVILYKYTSQQIWEWITATISRTVILILIGILVWFLYSYLTSDYESDVCGFITSNDCN